MPRMSIHVPTKPRPVRRAQQGGETVARSGAFALLARGGFVARGAIYAIIGLLAIKVALGDGGKTTNQQGALETIARQPFGKVLLILVAVGLGGYALWRFVRAAIGHGREASDSAFDRIAALGSGVVYAILCAVAVAILVGSGSSGSGSAQKATGGVLGWPAGPWLVGAGGLVLIGIGLYQGYRGISQEFLDDSKTEEMSRPVRTCFEWIGTFGHLARMVVFGLVGVFLIKAAVEFDPNKAVGLDGALAKLAHASYGSYALGVVAAGLFVFGLFSVADARYHRI